VAEYVVRSASALGHTTWASPNAPFLLQTLLALWRVVGRPSWHVTSRHKHPRRLRPLRCKHASRLGWLTDRRRGVVWPIMYCMYHTSYSSHHSSRKSMSAVKLYLVLPRLQAGRQPEIPNCPS